jgi:hypothetical protein
LPPISDGIDTPTLENPRYLPHFVPDSFDSLINISSSLAVHGSTDNWDAGLDAVHSVNPHLYVL